MRWWPFEVLRRTTKALWDKAKALPLWSRYVAAAVGLAIVTVGYVVFYGLRKQIDTGPVGTLVAPRVENLWFLSNGDLVGTQTSGLNLVVFKWQPGSSTVKQTLTFNLFEAETYTERLLKFSGVDSRERDRRSGFYKRFALSRDGSTLVYFSMGYLTVFKPQEGSPKTADELIEILRGASIVGQTALQEEPVTIRGIENVDLGSDADESPTALTFTDTDFVAVANANGKIELRDSNNITQVVGTAQTKLVSPAIMKPVGDFLAIVSAVNAAVVMLDMRSLTKETPLHGYPPSSLEDFSLAVSQQGRLAIGTGSTKVYLTESDGAGDASIPIEVYGKVKILSFYDEDEVLAGGHFQDIYSLSPGQIPARVASAPRGAQALAVNSERIAYASDDGVTVLWHTQRRLLSRGGKIALAASVLLMIGIGALYYLDRKRSREESEPPDKVKPEVTPGELRLPVEIPPDLVDVCANGEAVLYAGAGLSARNGLPVWKVFVHGLLDWAVNNGFVDLTEAESFHAEIETGDADPVADSVISRLTTPAQTLLLHSYLRSVFLRTSSPSALHFLLKRIKFSAVLTTNFDNLLESNFQITAAQVFTPKDAELLLAALTKRDYFLLKLYGTLDQPDTVMIAPAQYQSAVTGNRIFSQFMQTLFVSRSLLFVGASMEGIETYLKGINLPKETARKHFALVAVTGNTWRAKADVLERRYGIKVFPYNPKDNHSDLIRFLKALTTKVSSEPAVTSPRQVTSRLRRLYLENIGPFDTLDLEFDSELQIFLGDNGVGKSTILKAMALALCGDEARDYAERLLKFGTTRGKIILETDNKTSYVTEIDRNQSDRETQITSNTARPLEAEGWLALGFPPLRTTSWVPPKGPEAEFKFKSRPVADDLLPLVKGDVDPRLDKLKQWVVNLDYLSIKSDGNGKVRNDSYAKLIEKMFTCIASLTEGMQLTYAGVERGTNRIQLKTDDGIDVPIEALSQGTISLIGWVGILLQRLYEVFDQDEDPTKRYALVLMDEIDAHMHPLWQRTLINHLKKIFPRVQIIATTHSPLVIGGLPVKQVIRFARDSQGKVIRVPIEQDMTWGYTDQILTSMLFGLPTSLDNTTEEKMKRYYELYEQADRRGNEEEYEQLKQELMARVPPVTVNYQEKREEQLSEAALLRELGSKLARRSTEGAQILLKRAEKLRASLEGSKRSDSDPV